MNLVRYGDSGLERPGLIDSTGALRDLSGRMRDVSRNTLSPDLLRELQAIRSDELPLVATGARLGPCVGDVGTFICVGLNYMDHVREAGAALPTEPVLFMKATSSISGPNDPIVIPSGCTLVDWEVELGVVIGSVAKNVSAEDVMACIAGYCIVNDVSERAWQLQGTGQWVKGKSANTFEPIGPWLVTRDEIDDPQSLKLWLFVNEQPRQHSSTSQMIFPVEAVVSYISRFMTRHPGDIISTGTPPGVGMGAKPPVFLKSGDVVRLGVERLSEQCQHVS